MKLKSFILPGALLAGFSLVAAVVAKPYLAGRHVVDRNGNKFSALTFRADAVRAGAFTFDRSGRIELVSPTVGTELFIRPDSNASSGLRVFRSVAMPKVGAIVTFEVTGPTYSELAQRLHGTACSVVRDRALQGYDSLKCT